ncbi:MAG: COG4705 family protein [Nocardioidaceae bacterium]
MTSTHNHRAASPESSIGQVPLVGRLFPAPLAAKVPEILVAFWVVKILTTAGGEATSDYLKNWGNLKGGGTELALFAVGAVLQLATRRYRAFAYWFLAYAVAIIGTGVSDFLHLDVHIPYAGTTLLWAVVLAAIFVLWQRSEGTLSIHSITTQRREVYYWATVCATFALGTALGDFTAISLNLGYLDSGIFFAVVIVLPGLALWKFGLSPIAAFWACYVVTRPLGASFADYISKPRSMSGIDFGDGHTAIAIAVAVFALVAYLAVARSDTQQPSGASATEGSRGGQSPDPDPDPDPDPSGETPVDAS